MVAITPFHSVFDRMVNLSRAMDSFTDRSAPVATWSPALDAVENDQAWVLTVDLPGVSRDKVELTFERNTLMIRGERPSTSASAADSTRRFLAERSWGSFERSLRFPQYVNGEGISATFVDGVLTVTVPKSEAAKARKIDVA